MEPQIKPTSNNTSHILIIVVVCIVSVFAIISAILLSFQAIIGGSRSIDLNEANETIAQIEQQASQEETTEQHSPNPPSAVIDAPVDWELIEITTEWADIEFRLPPQQTYQPNPNEFSYDDIATDETHRWYYTETTLEASSQIGIYHTPQGFLRKEFACGLGCTAEEAFIVIDISETNQTAEQVVAAKLGQYQERSEFLQLPEPTTSSTTFAERSATMINDKPNYDSSIDEIVFVDSGVLFTLNTFSEVAETQTIIDSVIISLKQ